VNKRQAEIGELKIRLKEAERLTIEKLKTQHQIEIEQFKKDFKLFERVINVKQIENQKLREVIKILEEDRAIILKMGQDRIQKLKKELKELKEDIKLAKQCVNFQGNICGNKDCKNTNCSRNEKEKGA